MVPVVDVRSFRNANPLLAPNLALIFARFITLTLDLSAFLQACITALGNLMLQNPGKRFYCKDKVIISKQPSWALSQILFLQIAVIQTCHWTYPLALDGSQPMMMHKIQDLVPFIAEHWECLMPNRQQSLNWPTHIYRALTTESVFSSETEGEETFYSLAEEVYKLIY